MSVRVKNKTELRRTIKERKSTFTTEYLVVFEDGNWIFSDTKVFGDNVVSCIFLKDFFGSTTTYRNLFNDEFTKYIISIESDYITHRDVLQLYDFLNTKWSKTDNLSEKDSKILACFKKRKRKDGELKVSYVKRIYELLK